VLKEGMNVKVVLLPDGQDPDDFARRHTLAQVQDHIAQNEQDFINFKTELLLGEAGNDPLKRANLINDIADTIPLMPDAVVRAVYVRATAERFDMDEQILADRIVKTRSKVLLEEKKQRDRAEAASQTQTFVPQMPDEYYPVDGYDDVPPPGFMDEPVVVASIFEEPYLEPCEKEILGFILEEGCTPLEFDRDSKFYMDGAPMNVAEFIDGILADDDAAFVNTAYRRVYDEYFKFYDEGLSQQQIQSRLMNSMDVQIADVAKDMLIEKYQITVKNYEQSLTSVTTRLVQYIPKTLMTYQCKKVELILKDLTAELARTEDPEKQVEIMEKMGNYNRARTRLNNELGRV
jgi:DNA primase